MSLKVRQRSAPETCPLCRDELKDGTPVSTCEGCRTTFHVECGSEFGGCPTTGCKAASEVLPLDQAPAQTEEPVPELEWGFGNPYLQAVIWIFVVGVEAFAISEEPTHPLLWLALVVFGVLLFTTIKDIRRRWTGPDTTPREPL